jgi:hypothetical protein
MLSIKTFKCDCCDYVCSKKHILTNHGIRNHKQKLLNRDIINYIRFNREIKKFCEIHLIQTLDISYVVTIKEIIHHIIGFTSIEFKKCNMIDFQNCINRYIRNEYGISNNNGCFIGLYDCNNPNY